MLKFFGQKPFGLNVATLAALAAFAKAGEPVPPRVEDALAFAPADSVTFNGWLGEALVACERGRIFGQSVPDLIGPFAVREEDKMWRGEFWGKWFTSATLAYRYQSDPWLRQILDGAVKDLLATQTPDGGITTYRPDAEFANWDTWGRKYTLLGLLAYHELTGDAKTLASARRHADRIMDHFGPGKADIATNGRWTGMAASSILEPMVLLYRRTGDARYLQFAESIVHSWADPAGPDLLRKALAGVPVFKMFPGPDPAKQGYMSGGSSKAYEMMSCYEGLVELHRVTGEPKYRDAARKAFANIRDTEITILGSGSSWERWCNGRARQAGPMPEWMETCVTVTWLKFAGQLLRLTGDPLYADEIERSAYNPLLAAQKADGTWWCHYSPLDGHREPAPEQCGMHMNCCVASGPRGLMLLPALALMSGQGGPVINFYEPATATLPLPSGKPVRIEIKSDYPRSGVVEVVVHPASAENFRLSLRIPAWSRATKVELNGESVPDIQPGSYARLARTWQPGDKVRLTLDFTVRRERDPGGSDCVAITRGPVVFALDQRFMRTASGGGMIVADARGVVKAVSVQSAGVRMALDVPFDAGGKRVMLRFCDYASAGRTWADDSTFRVWLPQPLNLADIRSRIHNGGAAWEDSKKHPDGHRYLSVMEIADEHDQSAACAGHGYGHDPDLLVTGEHRFTAEEQKSHSALWGIIIAPLMSGDDPRPMTQAGKDVVLNREAIAINQDPTEQGRCVACDGMAAGWVRRLGADRQAHGRMDRPGCLCA